MRETFKKMNEEQDGVGSSSTTTQKITLECLVAKQRQGEMFRTKVKLEQENDPFVIVEKDIPVVQKEVEVKSDQTEDDYEFSPTTQMHIDELSDWIENTDPQGNYLDKYRFLVEEDQERHEEGSGSRIKEQTQEEARA